MPLGAKTWLTGNKKMGTQSYNCKVEMLPIELVVFSLSLTNTYGTLNQSGKETAFYVF